MAPEPLVTPFAVKVTGWQTDAGLGDAVTLVTFGGTGGAAPQRCTSRTENAAR